MVCVIAVALIWFLQWAGVPAALLLGPMVAGAIMGASGGSIDVPRPFFVMGQGIIGCLIARALPRFGSVEIAGEWPLFLAGVFSVIFVSAFLGWVVTRTRLLPGTTALWGFSPGAATAMTLLAEAHGADHRLVALMQYSRVLLAAGFVSLVAAYWGEGLHHAAKPLEWFGAIAWPDFFKTMLLLVLGPIVATGMELRGGALLVPLVAGVLLTRHGYMTIELPPWLLMIGYSAIGLRIGLSFTRPVLVHAAKAFPQILMFTLVLIASCAALGLVFVFAAGVDPLTAFLATSPGGIDSVAIIAASTHVDVPFVMTMQTARFLAVLVLGPPLARLIVKQLPDRESLNAKSER